MSEQHPLMLPISTQGLLLSLAGLKTSYNYDRFMDVESGRPVEPKPKDLLFLRSSMETDEGPRAMLVPVVVDKVTPTEGFTFRLAVARDLGQHGLDAREEGTMLLQAVDALSSADQNSIVSEAHKYRVDRSGLEQRLEHNLVHIMGSALPHRLKMFQPPEVEAGQAAPTPCKTR